MSSYFISQINIKINRKELNNSTWLILKQLHYYTCLSYDCLWTNKDQDKMH